MHRAAVRITTVLEAAVHSGFLPLLSSEIHELSIGQGLTSSPMENYQVFL